MAPVITTVNKAMARTAVPFHPNRARCVADSFHHAYDMDIVETGKRGEREAVRLVTQGRYRRLNPLVTYRVSFVCHAVEMCPGTLGSGHGCVRLYIIMGGRSKVTTITHTLAATDISVTAADNMPADHPGSSHQGCVGGWQWVLRCIEYIYM